MSLDQVGTCERCGSNDGELRFAGQLHYYDDPGESPFSVTSVKQREEDMQPFYLCRACGDRQDHGLWLMKRQAGL